MTLSSASPPRSSSTASRIAGVEIDRALVASARAGLAARWHQESGGLSGAPLRARSTALIARLWRLTEGELPIIGVGGIDTPQAAWEKIRAGASLLQVYTGLVYEGPALAGRICRGLLERLRSNRLDHLARAVGLDHR